ncbi:MAG: pentapeptide repeat-containing protein [Neobacillus sp.]
MDYAIFNKEANFINSTFHGQASYIEASFTKFAVFLAATFDQDCDFNACYFKLPGLFGNAEFKREANFSGANIAQVMDFSLAKINYSLDISNLTLHDSSKFLFSGAYLPNMINFSNVPDIHNVVDFTNANFTRTTRYTDSVRKWHYINLFNSDISKIRIDYQHFRLCFYNSFEQDNHKKTVFCPDSLMIFKIKLKHDLNKIASKLLTDAKFKVYLHQVFPATPLDEPIIHQFILQRIKVSSFPALLPTDEIISTYEKVLKNFDTQGQKVSYESLDIEYQDYKNGWFILPKIWNCYGYHKEYVFFWTALFLLSFTALTFIFIESLNRKGQPGVYHIESIPLKLPVTSIFSFFRRVWYALMYTASVFFLFSLKMENVNFRKLGVLYVILVYSLGILCLGYMANFVLQK